MMAHKISKMEVGGSVCLDIGLNLETDREEDENDTETTANELIDLIDRREREVPTEH